MTEDEQEPEKAEVEGDSFSFHKFSGPVSGEAREVVVPNTHPHDGGATKVDYVVRKHLLILFDPFYDCSKIYLPVFEQLNRSNLALFLQ